MITALVVIICCSASLVESLPWSVWPFGVGQMRQNYAPVVWPDEMAMYHPVYRRHSAFHPQELRPRPLRKSDALSKWSSWVNPSSAEVEHLLREAMSSSSRGDREVASRPILFAGDDDDSTTGAIRSSVQESHKQVHHRRPTSPPPTTTPCPLTSSTSNYESVQVYTNFSPPSLSIMNDLYFKKKEMQETLIEAEPVFNISKCESALFCEDMDDYPS